MNFHFESLSIGGCGGTIIEALCVLEYLASLRDN